MIQSL